MLLERMNRAATRKSVVGSAVLHALFVGMLAAPVGAQSTTPATVQYRPETGNRQVIFVNNPEKLELGYLDDFTYTANSQTLPSVTKGTTFNDLADPSKGQKAIFQTTLGPGSYRDNYEHVYRGTADAVPTQATASAANYAIQIFNPNSEPIFVKLVGKGFRTGFNGGQPFAEVLNAEQVDSTGVTYKVAPNRSVWLQRTDIDYGGARAITQGSFFSGVVDFDVSGGPFIITHLAYQNSRSLTNWSDMGFVPRTYAGTAAPESRVYKGLMAYPTEASSPGGVVANLNFSVNSATVAGELPVTYPQYVNVGGGNYAPSATATVNATYWVTHNIPSRNTASVSNDMFDILMPGLTIPALSSVTAPNTPFVQANIANWAITYHDVVTVTNNDTRDRTFALTLNNFSTSGSPIAYRDNAGVWQYVTLRGFVGTTPQPVFNYATFTVPAGTTKTVDGYFIVGCPAVGTIRHAVQVTN